METFTAQLEILAAAGLDFEVVDHCPDVNCEACAPATTWSEAA